MKRLVLAPHCDDETLGCGGLLAKYPDECGVVVF
jgi:N-acetylglucosamine malate deacetylase 1